MKHFRRNSTISLQGLFKKRQNPKTRQNRDNTHENDKKEGYKKNQSTEGKNEQRSAIPSSIPIWASSVTGN
jgi:hypothetical protein